MHRIFCTLFPRIDIGKYHWFLFQIHTSWVKSYTWFRMRYFCPVVFCWIQNPELNFAQCAQWGESDVPLWAFAPKGQHWPLAQDHRKQLEWTFHAHFCFQKNSLFQWAKPRDILPRKDQGKHRPQVSMFLKESAAFWPECTVWNAKIFPALSIKCCDRGCRNANFQVFLPASGQPEQKNVNVLSGHPQKDYVMVSPSYSHRLHVLQAKRFLWGNPSATLCRVPWGSRTWSNLHFIRAWRTDQLWQQKYLFTLLQQQRED